MKWLYNILESLQRRRSRWFDLVVLVNEIYFRVIFLLTGKKWRIKPINVEFNARDKKYYLRTIDKKWLDRLLEFFDRECTAEQMQTFNPHPLSPRGMRKVFKRWHYITLGIFSEHELIGYCVIRAFFPNKGLYAIIVGDRWRNRGIGSGALKKQVEYIARLGFKPLSAVRNSNLSSLRMCEKAGIKFGQDCGTMVVIKEVNGSPEQ